MTERPEDFLRDLVDLWREEAKRRAFPMDRERLITRLAPDKSAPECIRLCASQLERAIPSLTAERDALRTEVETLREATATLDSLLEEAYSYVIRRMKGEEWDIDAKESLAGRIRRASKAARLLLSNASSEASTQTS